MAEQSTTVSGLAPATLPSQVQVFEDKDLLYCIAKALSPRGRVRFSTLTNASAHAVDLPEFWDAISWTLVGGTERRRWEYVEGALFGNRLGCVLRKYGCHCTRLYLANCPWLHVTGLEDLARCRRLVHLDMSGCRSYSVDILGSLVRNCPLLKSLKARGCARIGEPAIIQDLFDVPEHLSLNLEHLDLQGVSFPQDAASEGHLGRAVQRLATNRLVTLRLGWMGETNDEYPIYRGSFCQVLQAVKASGATLRLLDLAGCNFEASSVQLQPDCEGFVPAFSALHQLRVLCLSNATAPSFAAAALCRCPTTQLVHLNLRAMWAVYDDHLIPLLSANPGLRSINVGCCCNLTDAVLETLVAHCPSLEDLDVCYARAMTARGALTAGSSLRCLTSFGFSGFTELTDADIAQLVQRLPGLKMIGFGGIPSLTDASLHALAASCPSLETLYAAELPAVTPPGLHALLAACPRLTRVQMQGCQQLTPADHRLLVTSYKYEFDGDMLSEEVVRAEQPHYMVPVGGEAGA